MSSFNVKPLIDSFNEYITENAQPEEAAGAAKEFSKLMQSIFTTFNCAKAKKSDLLARKEEHDSFLRICETLRAAENPETCVIPALAYSGRAAVCQALGELSSAAKDFRRSADAAAGSDDAWEVRSAGVINLASVNMKLNKPEESLKCYNEAEKLITRSTMAENVKVGRLVSVKADRGCICCRLGKLEQAYEDFSSAIELYGRCDRQDKLRPVLVKCYANRSGVLVNLKRFEEARNDGLKAVELEGTEVTASTPVTLTNLAAACKCLGYFEEAERTYSRVIMIKTAANAMKTDGGQIDLATLMLGRGEVREKLGHTLDAEADYSFAIDVFRKFMPKYEKAVKVRLVSALKKRAGVFKSLDEDELSQSDMDEVVKLNGNPLD